MGKGQDRSTDDPIQCRYVKEMGSQRYSGKLILRNVRTGKKCFMILYGHG